MELFIIQNYALSHSLFENRIVLRVGRITTIISDVAPPKQEVKEEVGGIYSTSKKEEDIPIVVPGGFLKNEPLMAVKTNEDILLDATNVGGPADGGFVEEEVIEDGSAHSLAPVSRTRAGRIRKEKKRTRKERSKEYAREKERRERLREKCEEGSGAEAEEARRVLAEFRNKQKRAYANRMAKLEKIRELAAHGSGPEAERAREALRKHRVKRSLYARTARQREKKKSIANEKAALSTKESRKKRK